MATIVEVQKSFSAGKYLVTVEDGGSLSVVVLMGDPQALASGLNFIINAVGTDFLLIDTSTDKFLIDASVDKILL